MLRGHDLQVGHQRVERGVALVPTAGVLWMRRLPRCSNRKCFTAFVT